MKTATCRLINSVWTLEYVQISENEIEIISYSRDNPIGYEQEKKLNNCHLVETGDRTVIQVEIGKKTLSGFHNSKIYYVSNPNHIFSYKWKGF